MVSGKLAMMEVRKMMEKERKEKEKELDEMDVEKKEEGAIVKVPEKPRERDLQKHKAAGSSSSSKGSKDAKQVPRNLPKLSYLPNSKGKLEKTITKVPAKPNMVGRLKLRSVPLPRKGNEKNENRLSAVSRLTEKRSEPPTVRSPAPPSSSSPPKATAKSSPAPHIMLRSELPEVVRARATSSTASKQKMLSTPVSTPSTPTGGRRTLSTNPCQKSHSGAKTVERACSGNDDSAASGGPDGGDRFQHVVSLVSSHSSSTGPSTTPTVESVLERIGLLERDFRSSVARAFGLKNRKQHIDYIAETMKAVRLSFNIGLSKEMELRLRWNGLDEVQRHSQKKDIIMHYRKHTASYVQSRLEELAQSGMKEKGSWFRRALHKAYLRIFVLYRLGCDQQKRAQTDMGKKLERELERMENGSRATSELNVRDVACLQNTIAEYGNLMTLLDMTILDNTEGIEEPGSETYIL